MLLKLWFWQDGNNAFDEINLSKKLQPVILKEKPYTNLEET